MNHYDVLGVAKNATADEIKRAYRKLASQHHPDKGGDTAKFQQIQSAYEIIGDAQKRQEYDNPTQHGFSGFGHEQGMNDLFKNFGFHFGDGFDPRRQQNRQPRRNKDLSVTIQVDLKSTLTQQQKTLSVKTTKGDRETVSVNIPKGAHTGITIKYAGLGDNFFESLPRGDLYIKVFVDVPDDVEIHENAIYQRLPLNVLDAVTGKDLSVTSPYGETFELIVPAGVQQGNKLRVKDKGKPLNNGRDYLYLVIDLVVPKNLSSNQIEIIRSVTASL